MNTISTPVATGSTRKPSIYYLAYGSNLSTERMARRCPDAIIMGTTSIPGYRMLFKKSLTGFYATIEQDANCSIPALVYKISPEDESRLDRCEGFPIHYYKDYFRLPVFRLNGKKMKDKHLCMAYILHENRILGEPSKEYFEIIQRGYQRWGFDENLLVKALSHSIGTRSAVVYLRSYIRG